ncbi:MAG TPA: hypothetical protein VG370_04475 [Chloroflexota bacterium]|nr:hypothetical protein [Chloroflexota bacterium]
MNGIPANSVWPAAVEPAGWTHLVVLVVGVATVYFATFVGVTSSNDGSHYALVRALVERRSFEISPYLAFAENQDYAAHGDRKFTDRPPGTALWAAPFYAAAGLLPAPSRPPPSKHDAGNPRLMGIAAAAAVASALAVGVFWLILRRRFGLGPYAAGLAALALAFGTTTWKYGSVLYSHGISALLVLGSLYVALGALRCRALSSGHGFGLGLLLGGAILVEYSNALFAALVGIAVAAWTLPPGRAWLRGLAAAVGGGLPPVGFLLLYNQLNFGGPFRLSTFEVDLQRWPNAAGMDTAFATPLADGLRGMLLWGSNNQGLFLLAPVALLSFPGLPLFWRRFRRECALVIGLFVVFVLLFAKSTNFNPLTNDGRYLTPFLGLWLIPLAFAVEHARRRLTGEPAQLALALVLFGALWLSVRNQLMHIAFSWNYDLTLSSLTNMSIPPANLRLVLGTVFPNWPNVWWLWLLLVPPLAAAAGLRHVRGEPGRESAPLARAP